MMLSRKVLAGAATALALASLSGCGKGTTHIVARVGAAVVTETQLAHWSAVLADAERPRRDQVEVRRSALDFLIRARWVERESGELGITAGREEVAQQLALVSYAQVHDSTAVPFAWETELKSYLRSPAATAPDQRWLMRLSILKGRLDGWLALRARRAVTHAQIAQYYRAHRRRFVAPEQRDIGIVESYSRAAMVTAKRALQAGASFAVVAKRLSVDPAVSDGIKFAVLRDEGAPPLAAAIFAARPHVLVGPLRVSLYYVFEVRAVRPRHQLSLAQVEARIRTELAARARKRAPGADALGSWPAKTECSPGYLAAACTETAPVEAP
jgi:hypothetical protein